MAFPVLSIFVAVTLMGKFGLAFRLTELILILSWSIMHAVYPIFVQKYSVDTGERDDYFHVVSLIVFNIFMIITLSVFILAPEMLPLIFGEEIEGTLNIFIVLALSVPFGAIRAVLTRLFYTRKLFKLYLSIELAVMAISFTLMAILVIQYGILGAAIAFTIGYILDAVIITVVVYKQMGRPNLLSAYFVHATVVIAGYAFIAVFGYIGRLDTLVVFLLWCAFVLSYLALSKTMRKTIRFILLQPAGEKPDQAEKIVHP